MTKRIKGLLLATGALVVVGGAACVLTMTDLLADPNQSSTDESSADPVMLWEANTKDINKITVDNPAGDSYTAVRRIDQVDSTDMDGNPIVQDVENYVLVGYEKLPMRTTDIRTLATRAPSLAALDTIEENCAGEGLKRFGLDAPVKVTLGIDGQDDVCFLVGAKTPVDNARYLMMDGDDTVYTVSESAVAPFLLGIRDYLGIQLTEEQADDDDTIVQSVVIERKNLDYRIKLVYDAYYEENAAGGGLALHVMEEPIPCLLNGDKSTQATHGLYGLSAAEVVYPLATAAQTRETGLDDPFCKVTMKTSDGKTTVFRLGNTYETENGEKRIYGAMDNIDCIYGFDPDDILYDDVKAEDVTSKNIFSSYVWDVGRLIYTAGDCKLDFEGMGESADDFVLKLNGERQEEVERYRQLYTYILQAKAEDLVLEPVTPAGKPMASIHLEGQRNTRDMDVVFYDAGAMKAYIEVDGTVRFACRKSYVDTLIQNISIFNEPEKEFTMSW